MEQSMSSLVPTDSPAAVKFCECGCGGPAPIAKRNHSRYGHVKGQPMRFIQNHAARRGGPQPTRRTTSVEPGQRIGRSVVLDPDILIREPSRNKRGVLLRCGCGREYTRQIETLLKNSDPSCGCSGGRFVDRTGQRFGRLIALRPVDRQSSVAGTWWLCGCDCGNELAVHTSALPTGHTKSCGCLRKGPRKGYLRGESALNLVLRSYRNNAQKRGLPWDLADADFKRLTSLDCFYCGNPPSMVGKAARGKVARISRGGGECIYNGLDRLDNTQGYFLENVAPCCRICNHAKTNMSYGDFMAWIARLTEYHWFHPEMTPSRLLAR